MDRRGWARSLVLFALAVSVRVLYVASIAPDAPIASVDAWGYHRLALNLDAGAGFSLDRQPPYRPASVRTPAYPLLLLLVRRAFGPSPRAAALVQAVLDGGTTLLVCWLGTRLSGAVGGRAAALLYALSPLQARFAAELLTETMLACLLLAATCCLCRYLGEPRRTRHWLALSAALLALAVLTKPNVQYLPLAWVAAVAIRRRGTWRTSVLDGALVLAVVGAVLAPWVARNQVVFGRPFLSTAFEGNIARVSTPAALAHARGTYASPWSAEWDALFGEIVAQAGRRYQWSKPWASLDAREVEQHNREVYLVARETLYRAPWSWLASHAQGMLRYLEPDTVRVLYQRLSAREWPPDVLEHAILHVVRAASEGEWAEAGRIIVEERWERLDHTQRALCWGTIGAVVYGVALAVRGAWQLRPHPAALSALLLSTAYLLWVPGPIAYDRFRVPVTALVAVLIGGSLASRPRARPSGASPRAETQAP